MEFSFFHRVFFCSESTQSVFSPNSYAHFYSQLFSCIFACFQSYPHCPQFYTHFYDPHNVDSLCITLFTLRYQQKFLHFPVFRHFSTFLVDDNIPQNGFLHIIHIVHSPFSSTVPFSRNVFSAKHLFTCRKYCVILDCV